MVRLNELFLLKTILTSNFFRPRFPFKLSYALTYRCNLKCQMCNIWKKKTVLDELNINEIEDFFKNANKFSWICISGGEPFLREEINDIVDIMMRYSRRLCVLHFVTNGQLTNKIIALSKHIHKKNMKLKIVFNVSIDGPPYLHDQIRGMQGAWDNAVGTFIRLKEMPGVKPHIGFTLSLNNIDKFKDTFTALKKVYPDIKFDDININIFQKSSFYYENQDMHEPNPEALLSAIRGILKEDKGGFSLNNFLRRTYLKLYPRYIDTKKNPLKCKALFSNFFLDPYGDLFPCVIYNKKLVNVRDIKQKFSSFWLGSEAKRLSYECSNNICPGCWSPCDAFSSIIGSLPKLLPVKFL